MRPVLHPPQNSRFMRYGWFRQSKSIQIRDSHGSQEPCNHQLLSSERAGSIRSGTAERIVLQPINVLCGNGDIGHRGRLVTTGLDFPADGPGTEEHQIRTLPAPKVPRLAGIMGVQAGGLAQRILVCLAPTQDPYHQSHAVVKRRG